MEGTAPTDTHPSDRGADERTSTLNRAARKDQEETPWFTTTRGKGMAIAAPVGIHSRQLEEILRGGTARADGIHTVQGVAGQLEEVSREQEHEQPLRPGHDTQQTDWVRPVANDSAGAEQSRRNEAYASTAAAERPAAAGSLVTEGFVDSGVGRAWEQWQQQPTDESETDSGAGGILVALCTLLAMFLVSALVWVQVREILLLGRTGKQKAHSKQDEARRSRSTSREECRREQKTRGWGKWRWRQGREEGAGFRRGVNGGSRETVAGDASGEDAVTGGFWPGSAERNSSVVWRAGARVLEQRMKAEQRRRERREYGSKELHEERETSEAEREVGAVRREEWREGRLPGWVSSEVMGSDDDDDFRSSPLSSGEYEDFGFEQLQAGAAPHGNNNGERVAGTRHSSGSFHDVAKQQRRPPHSGRSHDGGPAAPFMASRTSYSRSACVPNRNRGSSNVSSSKLAAWRTCADSREKCTFLFPPSSAEEEAQDSFRFNEQEDQICPIFTDAASEADSTWLSRQVRPARPSAAVVSLQQQYAEKCRDLFTRLGEVVKEGPATPQTDETPTRNAGERLEQAGAAGTTAENNSGNTCTSRFDTPPKLSEEALTEAEQLLTRLEEMFENVKNDFRDNQPGNITCMIRCCNGLLEKDGLMVLSRCTKVPRLMRKAQSVVETVVPCIWPS